MFNRLKLIGCLLLALNLIACKNDPGVSGIEVTALAALTLPTGPRCGDGKIEGREQCEDGNRLGFDGCSVRCQLENSINPDGVKIASNLEVGQGRLFVLPVEPDTAYGVYLNDNFYGDGLQSAYALKMSAYNENYSTAYYAGAFNHYYTPKTFVSDSSSFVNIVVEGYYPDVSGSFEIWIVALDESHTSLARNHITYDGFMYYGGAHTYNFNNLVAGLDYQMSWNTGASGDGSKTAELLRVTATNGDNTLTHFVDQWDGWDNPQSLVVDNTAVVIATVEPYFGITTGSYAISLSSHCGDGVLEPIKNEMCDDGNNSNNDGCSELCDYEGTLDLAANSTNLTVGAPEQFTAFLTDHLSNVSDISDQVTYHVSDPTVGFFADAQESSGMFIPLKAGSITVHANYGMSLVSNSITLNISYPATASTLLINEIADGYSNGSWIEVVNVGAELANLSLYKLRSYAWDTISFTPIASHTFDLPELVILPGAYVRLISGDEISNSNQAAYIKTAAGVTPYYLSSNGFVELTLGGVTQDFVRWGGSTATPSSGGEWDATVASALPLTAGTSLGRDGGSSDSNTAGDWAIKDYATPNGPNDVTCNTDNDSDGIPDCSEAPGSTFAGLPLYDWGARQGQQDIFIEADYMRSDLAGKVLYPTRETFDTLVTIFQNHGITLHFDIGDLYDQAAGVNPANHDLGGGNEVPYAQHLTIGDEGDGITANSYEYKNSYMDLGRMAIFHYLLFGDNPAPSSASVGKGEVNGNDFIVTQGHHNDHFGYSGEGRHAHVVMHELGHNLGLLHGGDSSTNYKPNYFSSMNYLYSGWSNNNGGANEGYRYYLVNFNLLDSCYPGFDAALFNNYTLNYSDGAMPPLNEFNLNEADGISGSGVWVDFNCNGQVDSGIAYNLNPNYDSFYSTLTDHDDWANLELRFNNLLYGVENLVFSDVAKVVPEDSPSERRQSFIQRGKLLDRHSLRFPTRGGKQR